MSEQNLFCLSTIYIYYNEDEDILKFAHCCHDRNNILLGELSSDTFYKMSNQDFYDYLYKITFTKSHPCGMNDNMVCNDIWKALGINKIQNIVVAISRECNLHCPMCYVKGGHHDTPKRKQLYLDVIEKLKDLDFHCLKLTDWGEPLIYIDEVLERTKNYKYCKCLQVVTNVTLLNKETLDKIVNSFDFVIFEIDCDTLKKETYEKLRAGSNYEIYINNLLQYINYYNTHRDKMYTVINCVEQPFNTNEISIIKGFVKNNNFQLTLLNTNWGINNSDIYYH